MKNTVAIFLVLVWHTITFAQESKVLIAGSKLTADQFTASIKNNKAYLVDVRTPEEFKSGHLKNAINLSFNAEDFKTQAVKLDKSKPIYVYSNSGKRSGKANEALKELGFTSAHDAGGFADLHKAGLQIEGALPELKKH
jgi:rhodanese-related sulfurtransferase